MNRLQLLFTAALILFVLGVIPAIAQEELTGDNAPAVVISDEAEEAEEDAWTFRYLVPSLLGVSAIAIVAVGVGYAVRIRGRYRVTQ